MERSLAIVGCSVATVSSGIAAWAIYKWYTLRTYLASLTQGKYTTDTEVKKLLIQHYVDLDNLVHLKNLVPASADQYHARIALFCSNMCDKYKSDKHKVLDVGSGVGGAAFELSKYFGEVIGADTSYEMIVACQQLKQFAEYASPLTSEGGKHIKLYKIRVPDGCDRDRVTFWDQDVCSVMESCESFDCVLVSNVLTDLDSPRDFLKSIGSCVSGGAILVISDAFLWPNGPEEKLGGDGTVKTSGLLDAILGDVWTKKEYTAMPYYIAQSERLAQIANAEVSVWQRNSANDSSDDSIHLL